MLPHQLKGKIKTSFLSFLYITLIGSGSLLANTAYASCNNVSAVCSASSDSGYYSCSLDYCADEAFAYDGITYQSGEISGDYQATVYIDPAMPACVYIQAEATSNTKATLDGFSATIIPEGTKTSWCQYRGTSLYCPFETTGDWDFSVAYDGMTVSLQNSLTIALNIAPTDDPVSIEFDWDVAGSTNVCDLKGSTTIAFPIGTFSDFVQANAIAQASTAVGCVPPS